MGTGDGRVHADGVRRRATRRDGVGARGTRTDPTPTSGSFAVGSTAVPRTTRPSRVTARRSQRVLDEARDDATCSESFSLVPRGAGSCAVVTWMPRRASRRDKGDLRPSRSEVDGGGRWERGACRSRAGHAHWAVRPGRGADEQRDDHPLSRSGSDSGPRLLHGGADRRSGTARHVRDRTAPPRGSTHLRTASALGARLAAMADQRWDDAAATPPRRGRATAPTACCRACSPSRSSPLTSLLGVSTTPASSSTAGPTRSTVSAAARCTSPRCAGAAPFRAGRARRQQGDA